MISSNAAGLEAEWFQYIEMFKISYYAFEKFVKSKYPELSDYEFVMVQGCGNDTDHEFSVYESNNKFSQMTEYDNKDWKDFIDSKGTKCYRNNLLFQKLGLDGYLVPGNYLVNVS